MNWKRGFLRLWIAASLLWVAAIVALSIYHQWWIPHNQDICFDARRKAPTLGNLFDCLDPGVAPKITGTVEYAALVIAPIGVAFALGSAGFWIVNGFLRR
jgi:hypothetical protein